MYNCLVPRPIPSFSMSACSTKKLGMGMRVCYEGLAAWLVWLDISRGEIRTFHGHMTVQAVHNNSMRTKQMGGGADYIMPSGGNKIKQPRHRVSGLADCVYPF